MGWPVDALDRLLELRQLAWQGEISQDDWRERDAFGRACLPAVDLAEARQFEDRWIEAWVINTAQDEGGLLTGRLTALLNPAPSDAELWDELAGLHEALADRRQSHRAREAYQSHRDRVAAWLTRPGSGIDSATGLPWSRIARYRVIDDPDVGPVPQYVDTARQLAVKDGSAEDRQRAEMVRDRSGDRAMGASMAGLNQQRLTWMPDLLQDGAEEDRR